jgi:hypothetical protein
MGVEVMVNHAAQSAFACASLVVGDAALKAVFCH